MLTSRFRSGGPIYVQLQRRRGMRHFQRAIWSIIFAVSTLVITFVFLYAVQTNAPLVDYMRIVSPYFMLSCFLAALGSRIAAFPVLVCVLSVFCHSAPSLHAVCVCACVCPHKRQPLVDTTTSSPKVCGAAQFSYSHNLCKPRSAFWTAAAEGQFPAVTNVEEQDLTGETW
jgi:hypothetical protein